MTSTSPKSGPKSDVGFPLRNNSAISIIPKTTPPVQQPANRPNLPKPPTPVTPGYRPFADKDMAKRPRPVATAAAKPYVSQTNLTNPVSLSKVSKGKDSAEQSSVGENSNSSDGPLRTDQRLEEVQMEDIVAEANRNEYGNNLMKRPIDPTNQQPMNKSDAFHQGDKIDGTPNDARLKTIRRDSPRTNIAGDVSQQSPMMNYGHKYSSRKADQRDDIIIEESIVPSNPTVTLDPTQLIGSRMPPTQRSQNHPKDHIDANVPSTNSSLPSSAGVPKIDQAPQDPMRGLQKSKMLCR